MQKSDETMRNVVDYYTGFDEQARLSGSWGQIEFVRTQQIIRQYLKSPPAVVLDVGGASGRYSCWLAKEGYTVHLIDPVPLHILQAETASAAQPKCPIASCRRGDARQLDVEDSMADAVLLMGPLYHLTEVSHRLKALREARRVLNEGGYLFAVGISRFASTIDGFVQGYFQDPAFRKIMRRDLEDGQHRNPTQEPAYFTDCFFHHPEELKSEVERAGFVPQAMVAIEGIGFMMKDLAKNWEDMRSREFLLEILGTIEKEPTLTGASPHIMCVARK